MQYLVETSNIGLYYSHLEGRTLNGLSDSDFANCEDGDSVLSYAFFFNGCLILQSSTKQSAVAQSTWKTKDYC